MEKWTFFIFSILLVPRMKAQVETIPELFKEIDEFYGKLSCPDGLIKPKVVDLNEIQGEPNPNVDFATRVNAYARYQLIGTFQNNPDLAKRCGGKTHRTMGLITDIWRQKLCILITLLGQCIEHRPHPPPYCCDQATQPTIQVIFPPPKSAPQQPEQQHATCTPFEQHILHPSGKLEKQQLMNCLFANKTSVIVPNPKIENNPTTNKPTINKPTANKPTANKPTNGYKEGTGSWNPNIQVTQGVTINGNFIKP